MKWPAELTLVRHDVSTFNEMRRHKEKDPDYARFKLLYDVTNPSEAEQTQLLDLAHKIAERYCLKKGDWNTPLFDPTSPMARQAGVTLKGKICLPDIVFVSPYQRTFSTLEGLRRGWPELSHVKTYEEERLREQEHGLSLIYNDWRILHVLHPEQRVLRKLEGRYWYRYPQGENIPDVRERVRSWINTLIREYHGQRVLAITHHICLLAFMANMSRWNAEKFIDVDEHDKPINTGVTIYHGDPTQGNDGRLVLNDYNLKMYE